MADDTELIYVGDGTQLGEVPTRNLTRAEVEKYGRTWLLKSGLYSEPKPVYTTKPNRSAHKTEPIAEEQP